MAVEVPTWMCQKAAPLLWYVCGIKGALFIAHHPVNSLAMYLCCLSDPQSHAHVLSFPMKIPHAQYLVQFFIQQRTLLYEP